jgi:capsular polysaccharide biosynthesis protein
MSVYEDEIDLRPYILSLLRNWWQVALLAILVAAAAFGFSRMQPLQYESTASILLTRTRAELTLAQQFPTITEPIDTRSRMDALIAIINSDGLALATHMELNSQLPQGSRDIQVLKDQVSVSSNGDVITITAKSDDPQLAADIANTWARQAVAAINQAYSSEQPLSEIQSQLVTAQDQYEISQENLASFIQDNRIALLTQRLDETQRLFSQLGEERAGQISFLAQRKQAMRELEIRAEALNEQLQSDSQSSAAELGDALAVMKLRANALLVTFPPTTGEFPVLQTDPDRGMTFNIQIDEFSSFLETPQDYISDLETIIRIAQSEQVRIQAEIDLLSQQVLEGSGFETLESIDAHMRELETQLEREIARQLELTSKRDLAWQAYQAISQKETEIRNAPQSVNQVNLVSQAITPQNPISRGTARNTLIGGLLGMFLGMLGVISVHWWRTSNHDFRSERETLDVEQKG